jgi:transcriptional regulator with XRE-family HTH domain
MPKKIDTYRKLRALMLENGYDQTTLAKRTGMTRQQISDRMTGKVPWSIEEVYKVCGTLFIAANEIRKYFPPNGVEKKEEQHGSNNQHLYPVV